MKVRKGGKKRCLMTISEIEKVKIATFINYIPVLDKTKSEYLSNNVFMKDPHTKKVT